MSDSLKYRSGKSGIRFHTLLIRNTSALRELDPYDMFYLTIHGEYSFTSYMYEVENNDELRKDRSAKTGIRTHPADRKQCFSLVD